MATADELAAFQARLSGQMADDYVRAPAPPPPPPPPPAEEGLWDRLQSSGMRLADNPAVQGVTGLPGYLATKAFGLDAPRSPTSFTRENPQPETVQLRPMPGMDLQMPDTPTLAQSRAPASASGGYGGGGGGGGMAGLQGAYKQAQMNQFGTLDEQRDLVERGGELKGDRIDATAHIQELDAARKHRDAEVMQQHQADVGAKHDAFLARNQQLVDDIASEKIDTSRAFANKSIGEKVLLTIAGALSGAAGQGPQFMQRMDNMISEDVKAQMADIDNKKAKVSARQNLFGQMMAESGDRRVAEMQTKQLMWESAKQRMDAESSRLGIPEVTNNAQMNMNAIVDQRLNPLRVQMTGEALRAAQAQAAAAAAAQRAAEERAWTRGMQVAEFGLKQDAQKIEMAKLDGKDKDDLNAETQKLGAALSDPKLASGRAAVENSKKRLGINEDGTVALDKNGKPVVDQSEGLPGVGPLGDFRDKYAPRPTGFNVVNPLSWGVHAAVGLSGDERVSRGDWDKMALDYQVRVTGSGGSEAQMRQIASAFAGAKTPQEQRAAVAEADAVYRQIEARHKAGYSDAANKKFADRLNGTAPSMPGSVTVKR